MIEDTHSNKRKDYLVEKMSRKNLQPNTSTTT